MERYDPSVSADAYPGPYQRHFLEPTGQGSLDNATHTATVTDPACGDELSLDLRIDQGRVEDARFRVRGCSGAIAVGSVLVTLLPGRAARPDAVSREALDEALGGVPAAKRHVLRLGVRAFAAALQGTNSIT